MFLIIKTVSGIRHEWGVQDLATMIRNREYIDTVKFLVADGHELEMIRTRFDNVPITKGPVCLWAGEMADFIFRNL